MRIPLFRPAINRKDMQAVLETMVDDTLGPGQISEQFVVALLDFFDLEGGIAFREQRRALEVLLGAFDLKPDEGILLSPLLPRVYAEVAVAVGLNFDWVDVDVKNGVVNSEALKEAVQKEREFRCAVLVCDTTLGFVPSIDELSQYIDTVAVDVSKGCGARLADALAGSSADYVVLSLEQEDILTTGGGAAVLGRTKRQVSSLNQASAGVSREVFLTDLNAALGVAQLKELPQRLIRRQEIAEILHRSAQQSRHRLLVQGGDAEQVYYSLPIVVETGRKDVEAYAKKKGVETRPAFLESIIDSYGVEVDVPENKGSKIRCRTADVPNAAVLWRQCLLFPLYPSLPNPHIKELTKILVSLP